MVKVPKAVRKRLDAIVAKRPRTVIQHLLKFGTITTVELTERYEHVAGRQIRQVSLLFSGDEVEDYRKLIELAGSDSAQTTIKRILHEHLKIVKR